MAKWLWLVVGALSGAGCWPTEGSSAPAWVTEGSVVRTEAGRRVLYGVGAVRGVDPSLARPAADNRARAAVARLLTRKNAKAVAVLRGVEVIDHWVDPSDGTLFALARLDSGPPDVSGAVQQRR